MTKHLLFAAAALAVSSTLMAQPMQMQQAKAAAASPPPPPPPPPAAAEFNFDDGLDIPRRAFGGAGPGGEPSLLARKIAALPVGKSFIETVTVPAEVTDPAERVANFKAQCKTVSSRVTGAVRRFRQTEGNEKANFAIRTVSDEKMGFGIRCWRTEDTAAPASA